MISTYIELLIVYLSLYSEYLSPYFPIFTFLAALIESTPIIGALIPGTLILIFFGFSTFNLDLNLSLIIFAATLGSIFGDMIGYTIGRHGTGFLLKHKKLLKISHIEEGGKFFSNHGIKSIFIGRFVGPIRPIISLIAGSVSMNFSKFMFYNILASFLWSFVYIMIGFYFGSYFRELERFFSHISIILTLMAILFITLYYIRYKKNKKQKNENTQVF